MALTPRTGEKPEAIGLAIVRDVLPVLFKDHLKLKISNPLQIMTARTGTFVQ
jgi:hypothetical protein